MTIKEVLLALAGDQKIQSTYNGENEWRDFSTGDFGRMTAFEHFEWRIAPTPRLVPLGPEDVPPGSVLRWRTWEPHEYRLPMEVHAVGVLLVHGGVVKDYSWETLHSEGWLISRDGGKTWARCEKEEK